MAGELRLFKYPPAWKMKLHETRTERNKGTWLCKTPRGIRVFTEGRSIGSDLYHRLYQRNRHRKVEPSPFVDRDICSMYAYQPLPL